MERNELCIAACGEGDLAEILEIEKSSFPSPWSPGLFRSEMANPLSRILVGRQGPAPGAPMAGYVIFWRVVDEIHLHNLAVRPEFRRCGIASRLLDRVIREGQPEGVRLMTLEVRRSNIAAQKLYERFGFSVRGVRRGYYTDTGEDALVMSMEWERIPPAASTPPAKEEREMKTSDDQPSMATGEVMGNEDVAREHFLLSLELPPAFATPQPGQFVMVREPGRSEPLLPRPLSVYGFRRESGRSVLDLLYRVAGRGTELFSRMKPGASLNVLGPLGQGFTIPAGLRKAILLAGGVGIAPLSFLLHAGLRRNGSPGETAIIACVGARTAGFLLGGNRLEGRCDLRIATDDGSAGHHGLVTDLLCDELVRSRPEETMIYACGPAAMIRSLGTILRDSAVRCEVSLEERMACGIGACLGCAVAVRENDGRTAYRRVCHDGPVFDLRQIG
ncbi:MAG: ribosomal protein S18-alanine N-acetyltransferase [Deltaproteobacteria bacterium]|nr:ribosomal protein S18-alanine N-acetyltransferase [Deltaproteobacteria bacterium]